MLRARPPAILLAVLIACGRPAADTRPRDLRGQPVDPLRTGGAGAATVLFFVATSCPISNRYAPELVRLRDQFASRGVSFYLVYPDRDDSPSVIGEHLSAYGLSLAALRDPGHELVRQSRVTVTPEAALFGRDGTLVYHGRVDDRFVAFGKMRPAPTQRDLEDAVTNLLAGVPIQKASAPAVGCAIP